MPSGGAAGRSAYNYIKKQSNGNRNGNGPQGASDDEIEKILGQGKYAKKSSAKASVKPKAKVPAKKKK